MTHKALCAQSLRKTQGKLTSVGPDGLTRASPREAVRPCTQAALLQKNLTEKKKRVEKLRFLMNCEFLVLTREKKKKLEKFIFKLFCGCPSIASYLG